MFEVVPFDDRVSEKTVFEQFMLCLKKRSIIRIPCSVWCLGTFRTFRFENFGKKTTVSKPTLKLKRFQS